MNRLGLMFASCFLAACSEEPTGPTRPHLVLVVVDTLRRDALGCYSEREGAVTPRIDDFARASVRFDGAISSSGWTLPSVASLLTGTWPTVHKARGKLPRLTPISPDVSTAAEMFAEAGYETLAVTNAAFLSPLLGCDRGFDEFDHVHAYNVECRRADETVDAALDALDGRDGSDPVFLLVHFFDPHLNYDPPEEFRPADASDLPISRMTVVRWAGRGQPAADRIDRLQKAYAGEVGFVDQQFGRLVDALEERGLRQDALIVLVSDHGEEFWEHGGFEHGHSLHAELVHVPLIVRFPDSFEVPPGVVEHRVRTIDVLPTACEVCEVPAADTVLGSSLWGLALGEEEAPRAAFSESTLYGRDQIAWRVEKYALIGDALALANGAFQLYDLERDPRELRDLSSQDPERARGLQLELLGHQARLRERARRTREAPQQDMSPERVMRHVESLRSLGYLDDDR